MHSTLNSGKASRSDKISARVLKECANEVSDALVLLFKPHLVKEQFLRMETCSNYNPSLQR